MTAPCGEKKCHRHPKLPWLVCFCMTMCETKSSHQIIETVASTRGRHLVLFPHCPHLAFFSKMFCIFSFTCYNICYNGRSLNYLACSTMNSLWYLSTFASLLLLWHCFFPSRLLPSPLWLLQCGSSVWGPNARLFPSANSSFDIKTQLKSNKHVLISGVFLSPCCFADEITQSETLSFKTLSLLCVVPSLTLQPNVVQPTVCVQMPLVPLPIFDCPRISGLRRE